MEISESKYWNSITKIAENQRKKGFEHYGQTLEKNTALSKKERIRYIEEELIDGLMYLEWLKDASPKTTATADEMFAELGYEIDKDYGGTREYVNTYCFCGQKHEARISVSESAVSKLTRNFTACTSSVDGFSGDEIRAIARCVEEISN